MLRFEKRNGAPAIYRILIPVICVLFAFLICGIVVMTQGFNPFNVYMRLIKNAFGSAYSISESLLQGIALMFCGLGVSAALRMSLNNIGAEGQYAMGAFAAAGVALYCTALPRFLIIPVMFLAGFLCGACWAVLAAVPRVSLGVNETIITLMFNYIALLFVNYWCYGPWRDSGGNNMPYSPLIPDKAHFPTFGNTRLHIGLIIAVAAAAALFFFYRNTSVGYQMRVIGANARTANYVGYPVKAEMLFAMFISGGLAGLAGVCQVGGVVFRLQPDLPNGAGYTGIIIAYLAHLNPFAIILISFLFGGLTQGGFSLQIMGVSVKIVSMIQGAILLCVLGGEVFIRNRLVVVRRPKKSGKER